MVTLILELAWNKQSVATHDHTYMSLACFYYYTFVCIYGHKMNQWFLWCKTKTSIKLHKIAQYIILNTTQLVYSQKEETYEYFFK